MAIQQQAKTSTSRWALLDTLHYSCLREQLSQPKKLSQAVSSTKDVDEESLRSLLLQALTQHQMAPNKSQRSCLIRPQAMQMTGTSTPLLHRQSWHSSVQVTLAAQTLTPSQRLLIMAQQGRSACRSVCSFTDVHLAVVRRCARVLHPQPLHLQRKTLLHLQMCC